MGHEDQFPPPGLSARYRFGQAAFAGTGGNGREALKADLAGGLISLNRTINFPHSRPADTRVWRQNILRGSVLERTARLGIMTASLVKAEAAARDRRRALRAGKNRENV